MCDMLMNHYLTLIFIYHVIQNQVKSDYGAGEIVVVNINGLNVMYGSWFGFKLIEAEWRKYASATLAIIDSEHTHFRYSISLLLMSWRHQGARASAVMVLIYISKNMHTVLLGYVSFCYNTILSGFMRIPQFLYSLWIVWIDSPALRQLYDYCRNLGWIDENQTMTNQNKSLRRTFQLAHKGKGNCLRLISFMGTYH